MLSFFPQDVLDEIWDLIESVFEGFPTYSYASFITCFRINRSERLQSFLEEIHRLTTVSFKSRTVHSVDGISRHFDEEGRGNRQLGRLTDKQTDKHRQADGRTDGQTDRSIDRSIERSIDRSIDRQTDR